MKKSIALLLALVLCLGILAGCQQTPAETTAPAGTTAPVQTTAPTETTAPAPAEWSFEGKSLDVIGGHDLNDLPIDQFIEDTIGLDVKWTPRDDQQVQAMMTDKVTPSLLWGYGPEYGHEMGRYGAFINLYDYKDIMPNFFARYEVYGDEIKNAYETAPGELYSAPVFLNGNTECYAWLYREDVFQALNLSAPTNWQELLDVCAALKAAYPESYPITMRNLSGFVKAFADFGQQFGVEYNVWDPTLDETTGVYYNAWATDEARNMLKMVRSLIDLGYMDVATLANDTAMWIADMASGKSFITHDKAWQLDPIEKAGKDMDESFSLSWWHNLPLVESDLPYQSHTFDDYKYSWSITTKCPDIELAVRYLDWMYSEEGSQILSWGIEGESFGVNEDGEKYFLEGYDATYMARYQDSGYIDFKATLGANSPKCQQIIIEASDEARAGNFLVAPTLIFNAEEQKVLDTYKTTWSTVKDQYYQNFLLGNLDINSDADWDKFKAEIAANFDTEVLAAYNSAYARYLNGEN